MKKVLNYICAIALMIVALSGAVFAATTADAGSYEDEWDAVFRNTLEEVLAEEGVTADSVMVVREPLYDIDLNQLGYVYTMEYDGKEGYALVVNTYGIFEVVEFYMEGQDPYKSYDGQKIYVSFLLYLVYKDGEYVETATGSVISEEDIAVLREKAFGSYNGTSYTTGSETFYYTNKSENKHELAKTHPSYYPSGENIRNACAPAAGANVIGFWTRYYPELMPGFTPGTVAFGNYYYKEWANEARALVVELYSAMGTNQNNSGTTIAGFLTGMNSFVGGKGRSIEYSSCKSGGRFSFVFAQRKLEENIPLVLFVDGFKIDSFIDDGSENTINYEISTSTHTMAGFGYNDITYTLSNGTQRNDTYIQVATGLVEKPNGYYNINYNTTVDECYAVRIY